jgi:hypothetical protein
VQEAGVHRSDGQRVRATPSTREKGWHDHRRRRPDRLVDQEIVKTARRYRTVEIQAGQHVVTATDPLPEDLRQALDAINQAS